MEPRISIVTLGVADLQRSIRFYERGLGWTRSAAGSDRIAFFPMHGAVLALYPRHLLAEDANLVNGAGFGGITLAHNVGSKAAVDAILTEAVAAGATLIKLPRAAEWGGYSGYFADPDGHPWEIAWNPHFPLAEDGSLQLPG
ncbi:MAG TPA: VOC family protein [Dehalococcoidia bacterium]|nr:VOC family protein [Dehalococcoidia bacterium]